MLVLIEQDRLRSLLEVSGRVRRGNLPLAWIVEAQDGPAQRTHDALAGEALPDRSGSADDDHRLVGEQFVEAVLNRSRIHDAPHWLVVPVHRSAYLPVCHPSTYHSASMLSTISLRLREAEKHRVRDGLTADD